tara:strand:- start:427 stop:1074 length:648 start_codon:yes stop_codon:yes gene_type:complete
MEFNHVFSYNYNDGEHAENPVTEAEWNILWDDNIIAWNEKLWPFPDFIEEEEHAKQWMLDYVNGDIYMPGSMCQRTYSSSNDLLAINFWAKIDDVNFREYSNDSSCPVYNVDPTFMNDTAVHISGWLKKIDGSLIWMYDSDGKSVWAEAVTEEVLGKIDCVRWCGAYVGRNINKEFIYNNSTYRLYTARMDDYTSPLYRLSDYGWPDNNWTRGGS